jgi:hypothetical protein
MTATLPHAANRIAGFYEAPLPEIPDSDFERQDVYSESILQAVLAMRALLNHSDKAIVLKAAQELFTLERTRLRHKRSVTGCREKPIPKWQADRETVEREFSPGPPTEQQLEEEAIEAHAKEVQAELRKAEEAKPANERKKVHSEAGRATVVRWLKHWKVSAASIPAGGFWDAYLERPVAAKPRAKKVPPPKREDFLFILSPQGERPKASAN